MDGPQNGRPIVSECPAGGAAATYDRWSMPPNERSESLAEQTETPPLDTPAGPAPNGQAPGAADQEAANAAASGRTPPSSPVMLGFASFLMLFVELALIRWTAANNVYVTNATNFVLLASFLGIGIGFLNAKSNRDFVRWAPLALVALVAFVLAFPVILASLSGSHPYRGQFGMAALPRPLSLAVIFVLSTAVMAGFGQAVARMFVTFQPLKAYRLDIFGSILGIAVFTLLSFLQLPPVVWGVIAAGGLVVVLGWRHAKWWQYAACAAAVIILAVESAVPNQHWSPY